MYTPTNKIRGYRWVLNDRKFADLIYLANFSDVTHLLRMNDNLMNDIFKLKDGAVKLLFPLVITINLLLKNMHWILHVHREPRYNKPLYIMKSLIWWSIFLIPVIVKYMKKNLDTTKPRYSEHIFASPLDLYRGCIIIRFYCECICIKLMMNRHFVVIW